MFLSANNTIVDLFINSLHNVNSILVYISYYVKFIYNTDVTHNKIIEYLL